MGWERRGSREYYYKKEREGSRVKSVYVGSGEIAHMVRRFSQVAVTREASSSERKI